jgi:hypothetical protein
MKQLRPDQVADWVTQGRMHQGALTRVIVRADKNCEYGAMQDLMDQLQAANANRFVLMTEGEGPQSVPEAKPGETGSLFPSDRAGQIAMRGAKSADSRGTSWPE